MQEEGNLKDAILAVLEVIAMVAGLLLLPICLIDLVFDVDLLSVFVVVALIAVVATAVATVVSNRRR
jgi:ABC-type transport system involved in cytochrome c biogenesis permease subunit